MQMAVHSLVHTDLSILLGKYTIGRALQANEVCSDGIGVGTGKYFVSEKKAIRPIISGKPASASKTCYVCFNCVNCMYPLILRKIALKKTALGEAS